MSISLKQKKHLKKLVKLRKGSHHSEKTKKKIALSRKKYKGSNHPRWKGGKVIVDEYIYIHQPDHPNCTQLGYVLKHRLVLEKKIGRYLKKSEVVHHINHNKQDNRINNLMLLKSLGEHVKLHFKHGKFLFK